MRRRPLLLALGLGGYALFVLVSFGLDYAPGKEMGRNFFTFCAYMVKILPCAFLLIGLFEVWVKAETVEAHLGEEAGLRGHLWAVLLAGMSVGGLYVALPVAASLGRKGASLSVIFTYLGAAAICRLPMTIFEASFLGLTFSMVRLGVSLPLVVAASMVLGNNLTKRGYHLKADK